MNELARSISATRAPWVLGFLTLACGSSGDAPTPEAFVPPSALPAPGPGAPQAPAGAPSTPVAVDSTEGAPGGAMLDDMSAGEAGAQPPTVACTDVPPDAQFTCAEQAGWGKCGEAWMQSSCNEKYTMKR